MLISLLSTGIAPRTFYAGDGSGERPRAHYDGLPADFVAEAIATIGADGRDGFRSYDVMNPHDDGISLDVIVDWLIDEGMAITRIDDHDEWVTRFEGALRGLPEAATPALGIGLARRLPNSRAPLRGAVAPTDVFREAVQDRQGGTRRTTFHTSTSN